MTSAPVSPAILGRYLRQTSDDSVDSGGLPTPKNRTSSGSAGENQQEKSGQSGRKNKD